MAKRSAGEALVDGGGGADGVDCIRSKEPRPSPAEEGGVDGQMRPPLPHRISSLSSSASSCSVAPSSRSGSEDGQSMPRMGSGTSGSVDGGTTTAAVAGLKRGIDGEPKVIAGRQLTRFINARILQRDGTFQRGSLTVDTSSGLIVAITKTEDAHYGNEDDTIEVVDCHDQILSPGFVDIQLNGAYGVDFSNDPSTDDILHVARRLVETGVTSFCPTMISSSRDTYRRILPLMRQARRRQQNEIRGKGRGASILGMHLEGPFFAPSKRGAHDLQHIVAPEKGAASVDEVYGIGEQSRGEGGPCREDIDIITLAPELPGALDAIQSLTRPLPAGSDSTNSHSVVVSCGHTEATYEDGVRAVSNGASLVTHLYNAMDGFHHRKPGLVGLLSSKAKLDGMGLERPFFSIICDGIHVHESAVSMAYHSHPGGCVLVTDAMTAMGLGDGTHSLGNMSVCIKGDRATLSGTDTLAGSVVSMETCVKRFRRFTGCSVGEALLCATLHPAMVLSRHRKEGKDIQMGILEVGANADLVMLNNELDVLGTWLGGLPAFVKKV